MNVLLSVLLSLILLSPAKAISSPSSSSAQSSKTTDPNPAISKILNKAGYQRMLSQRMAKAYIFKGMGINTRQAKKELKKSMALFEKRFKELQTFAPNREITESLALVAKHWAKYKTKLNRPASKEAAADVLEDSNDLLMSCHQTVLLIRVYISSEDTLKLRPPFMPLRSTPGKTVDTSFTKRGLSKLIALSSRQRMLSQRIALYYSAAEWGVAHNMIEYRLNKALMEYQDALYLLLTSTANNGETDAALGAAIDNWKLLKDTCENRKGGKEVYALIFDTTNKLLFQLDRITDLYEKLMFDKTGA